MTLSSFIYIRVGLTITPWILLTVQFYSDLAVKFLEWLQMVLRYTFLKITLQFDDMRELLFLDAKSKKCEMSANPVYTNTLCKFKKSVHQ